MVKQVRTPDEVIKLIEENKTVPAWVTAARENHKDWKALYYGEDFKEKLLRIEHIESEKRAKPRIKYSRPIKDLNEKLSRPIDSIYSAVGGSKTYPGIKTPDQQKKFLQTITNLRENKSLEKWLETYWAKDLYIVDPSGLLFLEYSGEEWIKPVYKSINTIRNYEAFGQKLAWVLFEPKKVTENGNEVIYIRYVDHENDFTFKKEGENIKLDEDKSFLHPFGNVPALTCSDMQRLGSQGKISPFDTVKEDQEEFMRDQSVLTLYKYQNGFPVPVEPAIFCSECRGSGKVEHQPCKTCDGTGELMRKDVTDAIKIPIDINAETINFPSNLGFFISPDLETWTKYDETLKQKTMSEYDTLWGMTIDKETEQTATEIMLNAQPKIHRLNEWSDVAQFMEWQFTEWIANWMFPEKQKDERVSFIFYGRNYLIRTVEQITKELSEAISNNLPDSMKDKLYIEYLTTKYKNDPESLSFELKKSQLEYWPFYSLDDVGKYLGQVSAQKKMMFKDWWESLSEKDKMKNEKDLEKDRDKWMKENNKFND
ncbi:hypothetical protein KAR91_36895 [Candidatus Pacearchaeota archaeon]|nr:hypothetical protein [Candidatus Pacearchaeota archaeon]